MKKRRSNDDLNLMQPIECTYVWIDETGENILAKTKSHPFIPESPSKLPILRKFVSSTCKVENSNAIKILDLNPVAIYRDPLTGGNNKLVLCETQNEDGTPTVTNHRRACLEVMKKANDFNPLFEMEQNYLLVDTDFKSLWSNEWEHLVLQGADYCGVGTNKEKVFGRDVAEAYYRSCLYSGITICGSNTEILPMQWKFQVGPCEGIVMADDFWMARFILARTAMNFGIRACFHTQSLPAGVWSGAGCTINFSTKTMRDKNGILAIETAIDKLKLKHAEHMLVYDQNEENDNRQTSTGGHGTSKLNNFSHGIGSCHNVSVRIPKTVMEDGKGYLEDHRPSSVCDPYRVTERIVRTICLDE